LIRPAALALALVSTPAAASNCAPWQIAAIGFFASEKCRTTAMTFGSSRRYSGARPPGMTSAS
jgi:hypothetical protein